MVERWLRLAAVTAAAAVLAGCAAGDARIAPVDEVSVSGTGVRSSSSPPVAAPPASSAGGTAVVSTLPGEGGARVQALGTDPAPAPGPTPLAAVTPSTTAPPASPDVARAIATPAPPLSPPVVALVNDANQRSSAGQHDGAAASIERALQIEPGNAWLWHRLARERLAQGRGGDAESLAARSNSLAPGDARLQAGNWRVIEQARRQRGDSKGAAEAAARAGGLEQG